MLLLAYGRYLDADFVSTLLEILVEPVLLEVWQTVVQRIVSTLLEILVWVEYPVGITFTLQFQPFLRFWRIIEDAKRQAEKIVFQPFLRFWTVSQAITYNEYIAPPFQPFLRFWGSRVWFLWVFKFFFGFL